VNSLFDELTGKLAQDPRLTKRSGARADLGLLMFNARDSFRELWLAADMGLADAEGAGDASQRLRVAVEELRPIFGERRGPAQQAPGEDGHAR
jgi:hypothetical protein